MASAKPGGKTDPKGKSTGDASGSRRAALRAQQEAEAKAKRINRIVIGVVIVLAVALVAVFVVIIAMQASNSNSGITPKSATSDGKGLYPDSRPDIAEGTPVVETFFDYQCSGCSAMEAYFGEQLSQLSQNGQIDLVFRPMIFLDGSQGHEADGSRRAAIAATCAADQGMFEPFHKEAFSLQQTGFTDQALRETIPTKIGMEGDKLAAFQKCYDDESTLNFVKNANEAAGRDGVTSTPTILVNGRLLDRQLLDPSNPQSMWTQIQATAAAAR
jgi:protein-disulfide isomerase